MLKFLLTFSCITSTSDHTIFVSLFTYTESTTSIKMWLGVEILLRTSKFRDSAGKSKGRNLWYIEIIFWFRVNWRIHYTQRIHKHSMMNQNNLSTTWHIFTNISLSVSLTSLVCKVHCNVQWVVTINHEERTDNDMTKMQTECKLTFMNHQEKEKKREKREKIPSWTA